MVSEGPTLRQIFMLKPTGCVNGALGKHIWDIHLDKALNKSSLYVRT